VTVPGKPRRVEIDFVRGIAILLVMGCHFRKPTTGIAVLDCFNWAFGTAGGHGVDLFFVLSGFLVGGLLLKEYKIQITLSL
jgi:peptidoglycan/LPS O-acetylase OafA/YrhL